ncbi:MAG: hypothetical protein J6Q64_02065, partial [Clostridia bacterium]|nr:hypothetical protein [Clostridia bacterium]
MKKTTKILLLVLSFVLVFTVSAVVSFAAEDKDWGDVKVLQEFDFETVADEYFHNGDESFDNAVVEGASFVFAKYSDYGHRTGFVRSIVSYDGNTAVAYEYSEMPNKLDSYLYVKLGDAPTKSGGNSMANNAYYVIDWDMYSPTGFYGEKAGPSFKFIFTRYDASGTTKYDKLNNVTFSQIKTDKNGNTTINGVTLASSSQWQHYTVILEIVKQYDETGNLLYNINGHLFVDGVFVQTLPGMLSDLTAADFLTVDGEIKTSLINLTEMRFEFIRTGKNTTETKPADRERATRSIAFDNYSARSFSKYYADVEQIASVVNGSKNLTEWKDTKFTADYNHPFGQLVATVTAPDGTTSYYDNARDAFAGAAAGSVVDLYKDVESATINSAVLVNTNGYDFNFSSSRYSARIIENTVEGETVKSYKFSRSQNSELAVYWDIDGENNLFAITTSILGTVPSYPEDLSDYIVYEYAADDTAKARPLSAKKLVGWAYSKDATKPDNIGKVTVWDIESPKGAWIALYPVFEQLAIRVIDTEGNISFYSSLGDAISASPAGATVELGMDLELTDGFNVSKELTVDLNGHRIILNSNDVVNTKKENGSIGYGTKPALFKVPEGVKFSITSSLPGAEIFVSACVAQLNFDGTPFGNPQIMGSSVVYLSGSGAKDVDITVNGENLTVYASTLVAEWSSNLHGLVTINGGNYYRTISDLQGFINPRNTNYIDYVVNDAFLCAASGKGAIMSDSGAATTAGNPYTITFNNCVFYKPDTAAGIVNKDADCSVYINNSVICTKITESVGKIVLGEGTVYNDTDIKFDGTNIVIDSVCQAFSKETPVTISYAFNQFAYSKDDETGKGEMLPSSYEIPEVTNKETKFNTWLAGPNN